MFIHYGSSLDTPICTNKLSSMCYSNAESVQLKDSCEGHLWPNNFQKSPDYFEWSKQGQLNYVLVKEKLTFQEAKHFCKNICSKLFEPKKFQETYDGLSWQAWKNNLGDLHIGIEIIISNSTNEKLYFFSSNPDEKFPLGTSKFVDIC